MKLVRFDDDKLGVIDGDEVIDISDSVCGTSAGRLQAYIEALAVGKISGADIEGGNRTRHALADITIRNPLPLPPKIIAAPVNYLDHQVEMKYAHTVADLGIFLKARTSTIGPLENVVLPYSDQRFDQEAELAVIIGKTANNVTPDEAKDIIFGYSCLFDMSMRSTEDRSTRKSFDTFTPVGPWIVSADEIADPAALHMQCWVNGELRQDTSLADLIFDVPLLISYASSIMTLEPGDIIATGTPAGVGPLSDGDTVSMEITNIGRLEVGVTSTGSIPYNRRPGAQFYPELAQSRA
ncbi:fumarylacetoacetate hydrolase family protein [Paenarthrobacter sp. CM16]|uniref:fumarylacetoacetate hydrolase family protein n=1 Tax=Paenarthrobacter sp. CM16 TaxID=2738447 RepID=UPI00155179A3|nr:fumarylacetoacetate hydrolase family protein [Paenarthrobacter sp. CM16]NQD86448.1 fumarylacetoacetate hydrolase family protein [Paenarthrobacter sp. CM16]